MTPLPPFDLAQSLEKAFGAFAAGRIDVASNMAQSIIKRFPREANAHYLIGNINHQNKQFDKAAKFYKKAYKFDRNNVGALAGLGTVALDTHQYKDAILHFQKALKLAKKPEASLLNNLAIAYKGDNKILQAKECFKKAAKIDPNAATAPLNLGLLACELGFFKEATALYKITLKLAPKNVEALTNLGGIYRLEGDLSEAEKLLKKALKIDPGHLSAYNNLAHTYIDMGDFKQAEQCYRKSISITAGSITAGSITAGSITAGTAGLIAVGQVKTQIELADLLYSQGYKNEATTLFKDALKDIDISKAINIDAYTLHRMGIAFERLKNHKEAFICYKRAHDQWNETLHAGGNGYDPKVSERALEKTIDIFSKTPPRRTKVKKSADKSAGNPSRSPIFITGMPRSGTSLLEQILASHPDIFGAGELNFIPAIKEQLIKEYKNWLDAIPNISNEQLRAFGNQYLARIKALANGERFFIDKLPHNFQNIGLIRLIFPNALIIHNKRNPMDTCLSVFKQKFGSELQFDHSLKDIAHFYHYYDKITKFYQKWDTSIVTVQYENIIANQEAETRRLLKLIGVAWNEKCLQFHKTDRQVKTASRLQVRQPLYNSSVEKWRVFEKELQPLIKGLGALAP